MLAIGSYQETYPCGGSVVLTEIHVNPHISVHGRDVMVLMNFFLNEPMYNISQVYSTYANRREIFYDSQSIGDLPRGYNTVVVRGTFPRLSGSVESQIRIVDEQQNMLICVSNRYIEEIAF